MPKFTSTEAHPGSHRTAVLVVVLACLIAASYLSLVVITRTERLLFPGNPIAVPGGATISRVLPGIDVSGSTADSSRINLLVVGIDRRPSDGPLLTRTDTIEIASIDPATKSAKIVGIPRDLIVKIPTRNAGSTFEDRVNTPLVYAQTEHYPQGPVGLMEQVIENNFGITIDHYVLIDFNGFTTLIDALGGIDVNVPTEVSDPYYSRSELPGDYNPQHFYPGLQHMDGETALAYARIRYNSDDLDRIQRQQRVIFAAIAKAESLNLLMNPISLWPKYKDTIQTDINDLQLPGYALLAKQVEGNISALSLGPYTRGYTTAQGADVLAGDWPKIREVMNAVFTSQPAAGGTASAVQASSP